MGGSGALGVLGLMPAHWWAELGPRISGCRALGVPGLVPVNTGIWGWVPFVDRVKSWDGLGSGGLKATCLPVGGALSPPG